MVFIGQTIGLLIRVMTVRKGYSLEIVKLFELCGPVKIVGTQLLSSYIPLCQPPLFLT